MASPFERLPGARRSPAAFVLALAVVVALFIPHPWSKPQPEPGPGLPPIGAPGGDTTTTTTVDHFTEVMNIGLDVSGQPGTVNAFWAENFPKWWPGKQYTPPSKIVPYHRGEVPDTVCGESDPDPDHWDHNAGYCRADGSISYEIELMQEVYAEDDSLPVAVLAHEWTHLVQHQSGYVKEFTVESELYADCGAGLYFDYASDLGMLDTNDLSNGARSFYDGGDETELWFDSDHHGKPEQRWTSFMAGFLGTISDCYRIGTTHPAGNVVLNAGPYRIPLVAGAEATTIEYGYRVDFPDVNTSVYVYPTTDPGQSPSKLLEAGTKNTHVLDYSLHELELASSQETEAVEIANLGDIGGKFAAVSYTFQDDEGYSFDGIGVALADDRGSLEVYVEGPQGEQGRNPEVDAIMFLTLVGSH